MPHKSNCQRKADQRLAYKKGEDDGPSQALDVQQIKTMPLSNETRHMLAIASQQYATRL